MDSLQTKTEKLLKYGKTKLSEKGVDSTATDLRGVLDDIGNIEVQPTLQEKTVTITENGTTEIVADSGYDGLAKVSVEANVQGGGGDLLNIIKGMNSYNVDTPEHHFELTADMFDEKTSVIAQYKFRYNKNITKVEIPDNITNIAASAFEYCTNIISIVISKRTTTIGSNAFYNCSSLTSIVVREGNTKYHSSGNCLIETKTKILILGCSTSVIPTDGSVTSIGNDAFNGCKSLTSITIPTSVTSIGNNAFRACSGLTSIIIPNNVSSIENYAFSFCSNITSITIPNSVTKIGSYAFYNCSSLTSITILASLTSIVTWAFAYCSSLTSITIPASVTKIENYAFNYCNSLTRVDFRSATQVPTLSNVNAFNNVPTTCEFIIPDNLYSSWIAATNWANLYTKGYQFIKASEYTEA